MNSMSVEKIVDDLNKRYKKFLEESEHMHKIGLMAIYAYEEIINNFDLERPRIKCETFPTLEYAIAHKGGDISVVSVYVGIDERKMFITKEGNAYEYEFNDNFLDSFKSADDMFRRRYAKSQVIHKNDLPYIKSSYHMAGEAYDVELGVR